MSGGQDRAAFPEFYAEYDVATGLGKRLGYRVVVNGALAYCGQVQVGRDIANISAGRRGETDGAGARRFSAGGGAGERAAWRQDRAL
jgi:5-methyltetrahydropteroyltriglutamate--homocysteine methyltransferase